MTVQPAFEYAGSAFLFIQHCCIFVFFCFLHFGRMPSRFCEICGRVGNETKCPVKAHCWLQKRRFNWTQKMGNTHPYHHDSFSVKGISAGLWVDLEAACGSASGVAPAVTCMRSWSSGFGSRGIPWLGALVLLLLVWLIMLLMGKDGFKRIWRFSPFLALRDGPVGLHSLLFALLCGLVLDCLLLVRFFCCLDRLVNGCGECVC